MELLAGDDGRDEVDGDGAGSTATLQTGQTRLVCNSHYTDIQRTRQEIEGMQSYRIYACCM